MGACALDICKLATERHAGVLPEAVGEAIRDAVHEILRHASDAEMVRHMIRDEFRGLMRQLEGADILDVQSFDLLRAVTDVIEIEAPPCPAVGRMLPGGLERRVRQPQRTGARARLR